MQSYPFHWEFHFYLLYSPVQLIVRFLRFRLPYSLTGTFLLALLLSFMGKWILTWHNSNFCAKIKQIIQTSLFLLFL